MLAHPCRHVWRTVALWVDEILQMPANNGFRLVSKWCDRISSIYSRLLVRTVFRIPPPPHLRLAVLLEAMMRELSKRSAVRLRILRFPSPFTAGAESGGPSRAGCEGGDRANILGWSLADVGA